MWRAQELMQTTPHTKPLRLGESAPLFVCMVTVLPNTLQIQQLYQWEGSGLPCKDNPPSGVSASKKGVIIIPEECNVNLCLPFSQVMARSRRLLLFAHSFVSSPSFLFFFQQTTSLHINFFYYVHLRCPKSEPMSQGTVVLRNGSPTRSSAEY